MQETNSVTKRTSVNGKTKMLGVIGNPIEHSVSPQLHNTLSITLQKNTMYVPFRVMRENLATAVNGLYALGFLGFNVTIPYKENVMEYIDEISKEAKLIGAVNTVKIHKEKFYGFNTDADGFAKSFTGETGEKFAGKKVVILGAGGAARAIAIKIALEDAGRICIVNRTKSKAKALVEVINKNVGGKAEFFGMSESEELMKQSDIIINTTSVGMYPNIESCPVSENFKFASWQIVYDVVYNPSKTKLINLAQSCGCKTVNGLGMLYYQGIYAWQIWMDCKIKEDVLDKVYKMFVKDVYGNLNYTIRAR